MQKRNVVHRAIDETVKHYETYLTTIIALLLASVVIFGLGGIIYSASKYIFQAIDIKILTYLSINAIYRITAYVFGIIFTTYMTGLFVKASLSTKGFRKNLKSLHDDFISLLLLNIVLLVLGLLATGPLFGIVIVMFTNPSYSTFLAALLLASFIILSFLFTIWFVLTPFTLLDKHLSVTQAIKKTFKQVYKKEWFMFKRISLLFVIFVLFQGVHSSFTTSSIFLGLITSLFFIFFLNPFIYSYLKLTYEEIF